MASNIRVVLEVDNKKYIAEVKAAENATEKFANTAATSNKKISSSADVLAKGFGRLKTAIAGVAIGALGRSLLQLADQLDDLSKSSGIAVGRIIELRDAIQAAGGSPEDAATALTKFSQAIDEAAEGSIKAQNRFGELKITIEDLKQLGEEDLMLNTLEALAQMEAGSRRTALMVEYFGKSFKTVDPRKLLEDLRATRGEGDAYAASVQRAADLNGKLEKAFSQLRLVLLTSFGPLIEQFSTFADSLRVNKDQVESLTTTIKQLAIVIAGAFAVTGALLFVKTLGTVGRGVAAVAGVFQRGKSALTISAETAATLAKLAENAKALAAGAKNIKEVSDGAKSAALAASTLAGRLKYLSSATAPLLTALRGISIAVVAIGTAFSLIGIGLTTTGEIFTSTTDVIINNIARIIEMLAELAGAWAGAGFGAAAGSFFGPVGTIIGGIAGLIAGGLGFGQLADKAKASRVEAEKLEQALNRAGAGRGTGGPQAVAGEGVAVATGNGVLGTTTTTLGRDVDQTERANAISQIKQIGDELSKNLAKRKEQLGVDKQAIGLQEDEAEALRTANEVRQQIIDTIDQLKQKRDTLGKDEKYLIGTYNEQIKALEARAEAEVGGVLAALRAKQDKAAIDRIEIQNAKQLADLEQLRSNILGYSITEQEKFNAALAGGEFRNRTQAEIAQLKQQAQERDKLTGTLTAEKTARETGLKLIELETSLLGRQFSEIEKLEQVKLQNPEAFARKTQEEVNALTEQARSLDKLTAKFKEVAFARDILRQSEDFAQNLKDQISLELAVGDAARRRIQAEIEGRDQLKNKLREINDAYGDESKLTDELKAKRQSEIDSATAGYARLTEAKKQAIAEDQAQRDSFNFGWDTAFAKYAEDANNAANQAQTYFNTFTKGFEDAIVKFVQTGKLSFKDLANSIIADFARIAAKKLATSLFGGGAGGGFGSIFSGIGSIFGFANGGNPAMNKPILVGENGPELMIPRNASTIVPNGALGGSQQVSVVYNIQAVDASSFRSMVARDPEFIYNVTEQGRKGLPNAGRRR